MNTISRSLERPYFFIGDLVSVVNGAYAGSDGQVLLSDVPSSDFFSIKTNDLILQNVCGSDLAYSPRMQYPNKVVVMLRRGYEKRRHSLLINAFVCMRVSLVCILGEGAQQFETELDWANIEFNPDGHFMITTLHPEESLDEVIAFAKTFEIEDGMEDKVVEVVYA